MSEHTRIAMWSGPRTRSTAMLRAWENRPDTSVVDEPLYAYYLANTDVPDPGQEEVIASQPTDWRTVLDALTTAPPPAGAPIFYQKHLAQHLLPAVDRSLLRPLRHAFLIRHPAEMLASYAQVQAPSADELGLRQQYELHRLFGGPVVDTSDLVERPEPVLRELCRALDVPFTPQMLSWPAGPRPTDGVWGRHWYKGVWNSTGFSPSASPVHPLPDHLHPVLDECLPFYQELRSIRISGQE
ncbi:hypothetical protein ACQKM2_37020 [Streptomyces sp. NPDC004126]|uniref:sulfotransferase-like domain-containing protein n=1 Tax=Streptomyces sp. NPDC004126 TaxID=3390695 RepID=UPI003CFE34EE